MLLRDPVCLVALVFLVSIIAGAVGADFLSPFDPVEQNLRARNLAPTLVSIGADQFPHVLGTDQNGRDVLSRLLHGGRVSLTVGLFSVLISGTIGVLLGLLAGYYRGRVDTIVMSLVNLQMGFPMPLLALTVLYAVGPGFINLVLVLAVSRWMEYARITRGMMLSLREVPSSRRHALLAAGTAGSSSCTFCPIWPRRCLSSRRWRLPRVYWVRPRSAS